MNEISMSKDGQTFWNCGSKSLDLAEDVAESIEGSCYAWEQIKVTCSSDKKNILKAIKAA